MHNRVRQKLHALEMVASDWIGIVLRLIHVGMTAWPGSCSRAHCRWLLSYTTVSWYAMFAPDMIDSTLPSSMSVTESEMDSFELCEVSG
jgi:hypothetical protein